MLVGVVGIVVPVLPGSLLIGAALLVWAITTGGPTAWLVFATAAVLLTAGALSGALLTGQQVSAAGVPRSSLVLAALAGLVGMVVVPGLGLVLFFALGLVIMEYRRRRELRPALSAAWVALRATGLGILVELSTAVAAIAIWVGAQVLGA
ncbi:DUF456 domain-containing protein [Actinotalea sp.]|uniref:DUF456 domain-containing protein n=1 Tax=Actinotalea sp. TaxID=1872145 RepID=UPI003562B949